MRQQRLPRRLQRTLPQPNAFEAAPAYPGYLENKSAARAEREADVEGLVKAITDQVMQAMTAKG